MYVYIVADSVNRFTHVGCCSDIKKAIAWYKEMPSVWDGTESVINMFVWAESHSNDTDAKNRVDELTFCHKSKREAIINEINPEWIDLSGQIFNSNF